MLTARNLYDLAKSRYTEARILLDAHKPDGAVYMCGYALELLLKRRIVRVLDWDGYPENEKEFKDYRSFKVHKLDVLLRLSGLEKKVQADNVAYARWQKANTWNSEIRYQAIGTITEASAQGILDATRETANFIIRTP